MQELKYEELETRASAIAELDVIKKLESKARVHKEIELMQKAGEALILTEEEEKLLYSFRRFKLRLKKDGEVFKWQTKRPEGIQVVEETANIILPHEI